MKARYRKRQKVLLPMFFLISLSLAGLCITPVHASDHTRISFDPIFAPEPPTISNVYPPNQSTGIGLQITCRMQIYDKNDDDLNVTWYSSKDGQSWTIENITSNLHSGDVVYWTYIKATSYRTKYWWKVEVYDELNITTGIYYFTTKPRPSLPPGSEPESNIEPVAKITGPSTGYANQTLTFYATYSYDPDGEIICYRWDFENDGIFDTDWLQSSFITLSYSIPGSYSIKLQVKDNDNATDTDIHNVTILLLKPPIEPIVNEPPVAIIQQPNPGYEAFVNEAIYFSSNGSYDPDGTIIYYLWDFGDYNTSQIANTTHIYNRSGNYTVVLTVIDDGGRLSMDIIFINIKPSEEPEERELPSTFIGIIIGGVLATIWFILALPKRKRKQRQKPHSKVTKQTNSTVVYSKSDDKLVKDNETNVDKLLIKKTNKEIEDFFNHNKEV